MVDMTLTATKREPGKHSARAARQSNTVPGVVYGPTLENMPVSIPYSDMLRTYRQAGFSNLITVDLDGTKTPVLIQDISIHPVRHTIEHVDFFAVNMKQTTTVPVPVVTIGESPAVKNMGGILTIEHESLDIRSLPKDIMSEITIDVSIIDDFSKHITVADLGLDDKKYEVMGIDPEAVICTVVAPKVETETEDNSTEDDGSNAEVATGDKAAE